MAQRQQRLSQVRDREGYVVAKNTSQRVDAGSPTEGSLPPESSPKEDAAVLSFVHLKPDGPEPRA